MQRNTRPGFEGRKGGGLGGEKEKCSCVWELWGEKQNPKAEQRQERAFLGHRSGGGEQQSWDMHCQASRTWVTQVRWQVQVLEQQRRRRGYQHGGGCATVRSGTGWESCSWRRIDNGHPGEGLA